MDWNLKVKFSICFELPILKILTLIHIPPCVIFIQFNLLNFWRSKFIIFSCLAKTFKLFFKLSSFCCFKSFKWQNICAAFPL